MKADFKQKYKWLNTTTKAKRVITRDKLLGFMGLYRPTDEKVIPPHYQIALNKSTILNVVAYRRVTFDGYVEYESDAYLSKLKGKGLDPSKLKNWKRLLRFRLRAVEIPVACYYLEQCMNWCARQKLMDAQWEKEQQSRIKEFSQAVDDGHQEIERQTKEAREFEKELSDKYDQPNERNRAKE